MLEDEWRRGGGHGAPVVLDTHARREIASEIAEETARIRASLVNLTEAETARYPETDSHASPGVLDLGSRASSKSRKSTEAETHTVGGRGSPGYDSPLRRCGGGGDAGAVAACAVAPASSVSSSAATSAPAAAAGPRPHVPGNLHGWPGALASERVGEIEGQVGEGVGVGVEGSEPVERHLKREEAGGVMEEVVKGVGHG